MGVLNILVENKTTPQHTWNCRMKKGLICDNIRLINYSVQLPIASAGQKVVRVEIGWISGLNNALTATQDRSARGDLIPLAMGGGTSTYTRETVAGLSFRPSDRIVPASFTVRTYDAEGSLLPIHYLNLVFAHDGHVS